MMSTKRIQELGKDNKPVWLQSPEDAKEVILEFRCNLSHMSFDELFHLEKFIQAAKLRLTPQELLRDTQGLCNALQTRNLWMEKDIETIEFADVIKNPKEKFKVKINNKKYRDIVPIEVGYFNKHISSIIPCISVFGKSKDKICQK